jgi:hypothetical protein
MVMAIFMSVGSIVLASTTATDHAYLYQNPQAEDEETIKITSQYPALQGSSGQTFSYELTLTYSGSTETKYFEFNVTVT